METPNCLCPCHDEGYHLKRPNNGLPMTQPKPFAYKSIYTGGWETADSSQDPCCCCSGEQCCNWWWFIWILVASILAFASSTSDKTFFGWLMLILGGLFLLMVAFLYQKRQDKEEETKKEQERRVRKAEADRVDAVQTQEMLRVQAERAEQARIQEIKDNELLASRLKVEWLKNQLGRGGQGGGRGGGDVDANMVGAFVV
jgi:hypothetical protein